METITVATAEQAHLLRQINDVTETVINEAKAASKKMLDTATAVGEGQGHVMDFSSSHVDRYRAAMAKRDTLLEMVRVFGRDIPAEAVEAAAQGRGVWFDYPRG